MGPPPSPPTARQDIAQLLPSRRMWRQSRVAGAIVDLSYDSCMNARGWATRLLKPSWHGAMLQRMSNSNSPRQQSNVTEIIERILAIGFTALLLNMSYNHVTGKRVRRDRRKQLQVRSNTNGKYRSPNAISSYIVCNTHADPSRARSASRDLYDDFSDGRQHDKIRDHFFAGKHSYQNDNGKSVQQYAHDPYDVRACAQERLRQVGR
jgi:hypothetical protein